jgi:TolA-binding protein
MMQAALANTHAAGQHLRGSAVARAKVTAASSADSDGEELTADWLGEQLQLLGEARRHLQSGSLEQASRVLDSYAQRFPEGVIGPQIMGLRAELREQRRTTQ